MAIIFFPLLDTEFELDTIDKEYDSKNGDCANLPNIFNENYFSHHYYFKSFKNVFNPWLAQTPTVVIGAII